MPEYQYFDKVPTGKRCKLVLNKEGLELIEKLASIYCTVDEILTVIGCARNTLKAPHNKTLFWEAYEKGTNLGKVSLRRAQFRAAEEGKPAMLIWLGKQYLGQTDKQEILSAEEVGKSVVITVKPASRAEKGDSAED